MSEIHHYMRVANVSETTYDFSCKRGRLPLLWITCKKTTNIYTYARYNCAL